MVDLADLFPFDEQLGYLSILLISFVGSLIVFIPVPYFPVILAAALNEKFDPHLIAIVSAVGTVIAKTIIFFVSYYGRKMLSQKTKKRMLPLQRLVSKYGWPGAFVAAATPIPDDIVYIPLGLARYSPWKFALSTFAGKVAMNEAIVWSTIFLGRPLVDDVVSSTQDDTTLAIIAVASIAVMGVIIYYSLKIDWGKLIGKWFPWAVKEDEEEEGEKEETKGNPEKKD
ncbi:YqaA family protein [Nitrososphaera viennensis]|uniref:DedA family protein n=2 Tax=Nitrososphaera viennensis TaxID=1034015 RepID=A0A060HG02_9ARCH|nr:VTT domain-containing protein [Nitrososphaera viennensis]AIC14513.1 DedA family protein [Nitrososphaera viennensis EN76]UVS69486.1 VTT domain-containing protein [Nitrososphaera viennensis]